MDSISMLTLVVTCVLMTLTGMCKANDCYQCGWIKGVSDVQDCANPSGSTPTVECNAPCMKMVGKIYGGKTVVRACSADYAAALEAQPYEESLKSEIRHATDCSETESHINDATGSLTVHCCSTHLCNDGTTNAAARSVLLISVIATIGLMIW